MKRTVNIFKALADETRLRILSLLLSEGELCVCDIMAALQLPQSTISRHLAYLRNADWVTDRREGVWNYYALAPGDRLRQGLAVLLKEHLPTFPSAAEDAGRLTDFGKNSRCA